MHTSLQESVMFTPLEYQKARAAAVTLEGAFTRGRKFITGESFYKKERTIERVHRTFVSGRNKISSITIETLHAGNSVTCTIDFVVLVFLYQIGRLEFV